jgi:hypothetical protein
MQTSQLSTRADVSTGETPTPAATSCPAAPAIWNSDINQSFVAICGLVNVAHTKKARVGIRSEVPKHGRSRCGPVRARAIRRASDGASGQGRKPLDGRSVVVDGLGVGELAAAPQSAHSPLGEYQCLHTEIIG